MEKDRLQEIEDLLARKKRQGNQLCWLKYNRNAEMKYDIVNAEEDIRWMIYEIKRLRAENHNYKEFIDAVRKQMATELGMPNQHI
jgi:hypothetical protein